MKKNLVLVVLALLIIVTPVLAAGSSNAFTVSGVIKAAMIDENTQEGYFTVRVIYASRLARDTIGEDWLYADIDVVVTDKTTCYEHDDEFIVIQCSEVPENAQAHVRGRLISDVFTAEAVTLDVVYNEG